MWSKTKCAYSTVYYTVMAIYFGKKTQKYVIKLSLATTNSRIRWHEYFVKVKFFWKSHKIWKNPPLVLMLLSKNNCFDKTGGSFFQILWPSHNVWTTKVQQLIPKRLEWWYLHGCNSILFWVMTISSFVLNNFSKKHLTQSF